MARVTSDGQTRPSLKSYLCDICQTGCDVMSVLLSQEADVLLANLAYGHDSCKQSYHGSYDEALGCGVRSCEVHCRIWK